MSDPSSHYPSPWMTKGTVKNSKIPENQMFPEGRVCSGKKAETMIEEMDEEARARKRGFSERVAVISGMGMAGCVLLDFVLKILGVLP